MGGARNLKPTEAEPMNAEEALTMPRLGAFDGDQWMRTKHEHHQIRMHCKCPFCLTAWAFDVTERPGVIVKVPDPVKLGLSLLCGTCKAFRRILYVCRDGNGRMLWSSPFFGAREERFAWANLRAGTYRNEIATFCISQDKGPWIEAERRKPTGRDRRLIDEADDRMRQILGPIREKGHNSLQPADAQAVGWGPRSGTPWVPEIPIEVRDRLTPAWGSNAAQTEMGD